MSDVVTNSIRDGVAVITLDSPPVNGLSFAVRNGLHAALESALSDDAVRALVVTGGGKMFCGGADIREFGQAPPPGTPHLPTLIDAIEASTKPVVAAIHGFALGGGLELALGCHLRVAATGTRVALPEVTLGIVPGAGGTQRLPRLIGVPAALDVIVTGKMVPAADAQALGILDAVVDGDVVEAAVREARRRLPAWSASRPQLICRLPRVSRKSVRRSRSSSLQTNRRRSGTRSSPSDRCRRLLTCPRTRPSCRLRPRR